MMEMTREMAIGKIHRAVVTGADLHYVGSITVDEDLLDAANIVPGQKVDIVDVNAARGNVRRDEHGELAFFECAHRFFALLLCDIAVDAVGL